MQSIPALPAAVISALGENPTIAGALWAWLSEQHYATVVAQNRDHVLVFVQAHVDFTRLEQGVCRVL